MLILRKIFEKSFIYKRKLYMGAICRTNNKKPSYLENQESSKSEGKNHLNYNEKISQSPQLNHHNQSGVNNEAKDNGNYENDKKKKEDISIKNNEIFNKVSKNIDFSLKHEDKSFKNGEFMKKITKTEESIKKVSKKNDDKDAYEIVAGLKVRKKSTREEIPIEFHPKIQKNIESEEKIQKKQEIFAKLKKMKEEHINTLENMISEGNEILKTQPVNENPAVFTGSFAAANPVILKKPSQLELVIKKEEIPLNPENIKYPNEKEEIAHNFDVLLESKDLFISGNQIDMNIKDHNNEFMVSNVEKFNENKLLSKKEIVTNHELTALLESPQKGDFKENEDDLTKNNISKKNVFFPDDNKNYLASDEHIVNLVESANFKVNEENPNFKQMNNNNTNENDKKPEKMLDSNEKPDNFPVKNHEKMDLIPKKAKTLQVDDPILLIETKPRTRTVSKNPLPFELARKVSQNNENPVKNEENLKSLKDNDDFNGPQYRSQTLLSTQIQEQTVNYLRSQRIIKPSSVQSHKNSLFNQTNDIITHNKNDSKSSNIQENSQNNKFFTTSQEMDSKNSKKTIENLSLQLTELHQNLDLCYDKGKHKNLQEDLNKSQSISSHLEENINRSLNIDENVLNNFKASMVSPSFHMGNNNMQNYFKSQVIKPNTGNEGMTFMNLSLQQAAVKPLSDASKKFSFQMEIIPPNNNNNLQEQLTQIMENQENHHENNEILKINNQILRESYVPPKKLTENSLPSSNHTITDFSKRLNNSKSKDSVNYIDDINNKNSFNNKNNNKLNSDRSSNEKSISGILSIDNHIFNKKSSTLKLDENSLVKTPLGDNQVAKDFTSLLEDTEEFEEFSDISDEKSQFSNRIQIVTRSFVVNPPKYEAKSKVKEEISIEKEKKGEKSMKKEEILVKNVKISIEKKRKSIETDPKIVENRCLSIENQCNSIDLDHDELSLLQDEEEKEEKIHKKVGINLNTSLNGQGIGINNNNNNFINGGIENDKNEDSKKMVTVNFQRIVARGKNTVETEGVFISQK